MYDHAPALGEEDKVRVKSLDSMKLLLVDMPFSLPECPAFGLTQIQMHLKEKFGNRVEIDILYLNHRFYSELGEEFFRIVNADFYNFYKYESNKFMWVDNLEKSGLEVVYFNGGLGDWFFRHIAFPDIEDNTPQFFASTNFDDSFQAFLLQKRADLNRYMDGLIHEFGIDQADMLGFTSRFQQQVASIAMAQKVKQNHEDIITVLGGPNCEPPAGAELAKHLKSIDYVLSGRRFLLGFEQMVRYILDGDSEKIHTIKGLFPTGERFAEGFAGMEAERRDAYQMSQEDDIDNLIDLDYDAYFESLQKNGLCDSVQPVLFFETSRGCEWGEKKRCTFCAIDGYNPRHRTMSHDCAIKYLNNVMRYADRCKYFIGTDSCLPKEYLTKVFPYVDVPEHVHILYEARVDYSELEMRYLAYNNIDLLIVGIESLSTDALALLNKGTTAFDNIRFLMNARKYNLYINWNILVGIPGETLDMIRWNTDIIPALYHLFPPTGAWLVSYQGNCEYSTFPEKYGIELEPLIQSYKFAYPYDEETLGRITYFKDLSNKARVFTPMKTKEIYRLSKAANRWKAKWRKEDISAIPTVSMRTTEEGNHVILDTREDESKEIQINDLQHKLLCLLDTEKHEMEICDAVLENDRLAVRDALMTLVEWKLLYHENGKYLSLVLH